MRNGIKIKQQDTKDCGAACLASIAAFHKLHLPLSRIRQYAGTDKKGTNVLGILEAAKIIGFNATAARGDLESLTKIPLPAIVHLILKNGLQHYVVVYEVSKKRIKYMDPSDGAFHNVLLKSFNEEWTKVIILLLPNENFTEGSEKASNLRRFWSLLAPHKSAIIQALLGAIIYTILGLGTAIYVQKIVDFVLIDGNTRLLNMMSIGMLVLLVFQTVINQIKSLLVLRTGQMMDAQLILGYYKHLLKLPQNFFDTMRVGEIISRVNDAVKIRVFINDIAMNLIVNVLITAFSISIMFIYYWKLALIIIAIIPVYIIIYWLSNKANKKWQRKLMENSAELETQLVESINSAGTIKRFGIEEHANRKTENSFIKLLRTIYSSSVNSLYLNNSSDFFNRLFTIAILWAGAYFVVQRELSPGELLSFYALVGYFTGPASSLISANKNVQDALIAADRLFEIIDLETEKYDKDKILLMPDMLGDINFNNVSFRYGTRQMVFENLSLTIKLNQNTAIVGESGSGKSTLLSVMQNLYPVTTGSITIGGFDLKHVNNDSLRKIISVVPQQIDLFAGTIIENIALGDNQPDMQRILSLCKLLGINDFVENLPDHYHSTISEQGVNLSGGQKQRLAIARALYRNPEILILDEATSSLDPLSEQKVYDTLAWFKGQNKTIITIAHKLSTIKHCDEILVLKNGKLLERGDHKTLVALNSHYASLWQFHLGESYS
ncbi:peptidase domain-containing ABC transporter [Mucilaginibacter polytrichastri]|uniref:Lactococcin-G-processing and transport ATP-binding protein LagD n=1 Tax=Mucilaginibacter polytrichastri TaxID=1302689 RepID=A0A1Q5ZVW8_9SPHI|nr:peptidase domain-containing ABC transporter [Mucilaginibacter polytrichastri]OKS85915.1 hypothetical protein RG47T_1361 [Mucilaginibacter polytrichastri]SFS60590.1 bacteriocin-processing peptidase. Cysteine peptidase. MEROPS family C39 [Mucilaginibacter polytrichastri]